MNTQPVFSIGITTYNRKELLKQTVNSLLNQNFKDLEIIVGNDYLEETLTKESLGISDSRLTVINNCKNLGELNNMNSLLMHAKGKYFAWIFDDDLCDPAFLKEVHKCLIEFNFPDVVLTSYKFFYGSGEFRFRKKGHYQRSKYKGNEFLKNYLSGKLRALPLAGFHRTEYMKKTGGVKSLSSGHMAVYSEYLLIINDGLLENIAFINAPLNMVRVHFNSWSKEMDPGIFKTAGLNLLKEAIPVLIMPNTIGDFQDNISSLLKSIISVVFVKCYERNGRTDKLEIDDFVSSVRKILENINDKDLLLKAFKGLDGALKEIPFYILKARIKKMAPEKLLGLIHSGQYLFSRFTKKSF